MSIQEQNTITRWLKVSILHPALLLITFFVIAPANAIAQQSDQQARGYVVQDGAESDSVAILVQLGHVQAAIGRVSSYDKEDGMANPFTPAVLEGYNSIDPLVSGGNPAGLSLQPLLSEMAAPETFSTIMSDDRSKRMEQNEIQNQLRNLTLRVDALVTDIFPSTRASALAISALFRKAGEMLQTGLATDGKILNITEHRDAIQLMEASLRLRVNKVSACERSTNAIDQLKSRGPLGNLLDRFIIVSAEGTVGGNSGDAFEAAENLQQLGLSLPEDDALICQ